MFSVSKFDYCFRCFTKSVVGNNHAFVDWYSNFFDYHYHSIFQILYCYVLRNPLNLDTLQSWIPFNFILAKFYVDYSLNVLVYVFSARANLLLIKLFSFRSSWNFLDKSPSLSLIVLFCCSSSVWFPNISSCSIKKLCSSCLLSIISNWLLVMIWRLAARIWWITLKHTSVQHKIWAGR